MKIMTYAALLSVLVLGCSRSYTLSYTETLDQMDNAFAEAYVNGSVNDAKEALHIYLVRLDELQRHPDCPKDFERSFSLSRGLTEARLAALQKFIGNEEKAKAFVVTALTHLPDPQATTEADVYAIVQRVDAPLNVKWKTQTPNKILEDTGTSAPDPQD